MVEYVQKECYDCHGVFPGHVMRRRSVSKAVGKSVRPYDPHKVEELFESTRTTTHYEDQSILLCPSCFKKRKGVGFFMKLSLLAAALAVGAFFVMPMFANRSFNASPVTPTPTISVNSPAAAIGSADRSGEPRNAVCGDSDGNLLPAHEDPCFLKASESDRVFMRRELFQTCENLFNANAASDRDVNINWYMKACPAEGFLLPSTWEAPDGPDARIESRYSQSYNSCMSSDDAVEGVTGAILECVVTETTDQDARLNQIYKTTMQSLSPAARQLLRGSQREWLEFRDRKCEKLMGEEAGGSLGTVIRAECILRETVDRTIWLEQYQ